jgi:hypothetical protein
VPLNEKILQRVEAIKQRLAQTSPGPWETKLAGSCGNETALSVEIPRPPTATSAPSILDMVFGYLPADADFIAHAPDDVAFLLEHIETLTSERLTREKLDEMIAKIQNGPNGNAWHDKTRRFYDVNFDNGTKALRNEIIRSQEDRADQEDPDPQD